MAEGPPWRFVITDLDCSTLTFLSRLASGRNVTYTLNAAAVATGRVPSDSPEINIVHTDGDPFLSTSNRFLYGFRREPDLTSGSLTWNVRFAGIVMQIQDEATTDQPYSTYTAFDPWQYLYARPIFLDDLTLPGRGGLSATVGETGDAFVIRLLTNAYDKGVADDIPHPECFIDFGQTAFYAGTIETTGIISPLNILQGTSLGEAFDQIVATKNCDIVLTPIYDPFNRPGIIAELSIYESAGNPDLEIPFAWDESAWSTAAINRLIDGAQLANVISFYAKLGQTDVPPTFLVDAGTPGAWTGSIAKYGQYWAQQYFPSQSEQDAVELMAAVQLKLRRDGKLTITVSPTPEIAAFPFTDYFLGDSTRIFTTSAFRELTGDAVRIQSIPIDISDNALEQVVNLLVSPLGT